MKKYFLVVLVLVTISCGVKQDISTTNINKTIDNWHLAAAQTRFDDYFGLMTSDAIFIGTDATENWNIVQFKEFSKPFFDRGKAWSFTALERNIYHTNSVVYFDELLDTQMGICRGSGVLKYENGNYKIAHYVLSIAVPNDNVASLTELKKEWDANYTKELLLKK